MIQQQIHTRLMGSDFQLVVIEKDMDLAARRLREGVDEIERIEDLLTVFRAHSQTSLLNNQAGDGPVTVDPEFYRIVERCIHLSSLTQGAFDITAGALTALYNFKEKVPRIPDTALLNATLANVGYRHILMGSDNSISLTRKGMRIGFGAVGKGYAADCVKALWKAAGVEAGVINASGDLTAWGNRPDGSPWKIGIADPGNPSNILLWLPVSDCSVATSGNYEQYFELNGIRYSHNIDPRTGIPVRSIKSVTIISPSAELSDALATAVTVMGVEAGLHLIDQLPRVYGIIIDEKDRIIKSRKIQTHVYS